MPSNPAQAIVSHRSLIADALYASFPPIKAYVLFFCFAKADLFFFFSFFRSRSCGRFRNTIFRSGIRSAERCHGRMNRPPSLTNPEKCPASQTDSPSELMNRLSAFFAAVRILKKYRLKSRSRCPPSSSRCSLVNFPFVFLPLKARRRPHNQ